MLQTAGIRMGRPINATQSDSDLESGALGKFWFFSFGESVVATLWVVAQPQASAVKTPAALPSTL